MFFQGGWPLRASTCAGPVPAWCDAVPPVKPGSTRTMHTPALAGCPGLIARYARAPNLAAAPSLAAHTQCIAPQRHRPKAVLGPVARVRGRPGLTLTTHNAEARRNGSQRPTARGHLPAGRGFMLGILCALALFCSSTTLTCAEGPPPPQQPPLAEKDHIVDQGTSLHAVGGAHEHRTKPY